MTPRDAPSPAAIDACDDCLRRTDLICAVGGRIDVEWRRREAPGRVLALDDAALLALAASRDVAARYGRFDPAAARERIAAAGMSAVCRCRPGFPQRLLDLPDPPSVLHVLGDPEAVPGGEDVAAAGIVGARKASPYGLLVAAALGRELSVAGVPVVSGLALGADSAAHQGALQGTGATIAVLAGSAHVAYPARMRRLHRAVADRGCVVSESAPGASPYRWSFVARNRIIAALSDTLVVVEATESSGSLTTADFAVELGRTVGAVPGQVTSNLASGTNALLHSGACVVRGVADVLDCLAAPSSRPLAPRAPAAPRPRSATPTHDRTPARERPELDPALRCLLTAVESGQGTLAELAATTEQARSVLAGLAELEFRGLVARDFAGRYVACP
jgi:DNA processing protein